MPHGSNFLDHLRLIGSIERVIKVADTENDAAYAPNVCFRIVLRAIKHLGGLISEGPHIFHYRGEGIWLRCYSKIPYLHWVVFVFKKNIARLQIPMDDFNLVQMLNRQKHLQNKLFYSCVWKLLLLLIF